MFALTTTPDGGLIAGGTFTTAGGVAVGRIARWDGSSWSPLAEGVGAAGSSGVRALVTLPNGDVIAGGSFTSAGAVAASNIARWDGRAWSPLGQGVSGGLTTPVEALLALPNGEVIAGGSFTTASGAAANRVARWNGQAWTALGSGVDDNTVRSLAVLPKGDVVAAGSFNSAGGVSASGIALWNGREWRPIGAGVLTFPRALTTLLDGTLVAAGRVRTTTFPGEESVARWDGQTWSTLGSGVSGAGSGQALTTLPDGALFAGGSFTALGGGPASNVARWDGQAWSALGRGLSSPVLALAVRPNNEVIAGGGFLSAGDARVNRVARWNGSSWSPMGQGVSGSISSIITPSVDALQTLPNGDIVAGGRFTRADDVAASNVARWNGQAWSALGAGVDNAVRALEVLPGGDLLAGGSFSRADGITVNGVARWTGAAWAPLGTGVGNSVEALTTSSTGDVFAGGFFTTAGERPANYIARWDGSSWSALGSGVSGGSLFAAVLALTTLDDGSIVAGGSFTTAGAVPANALARWDGTAWSAIATSASNAAIIRTLLTLPTGDLIVGGQFTSVDGVPASNIARWNGVAWSALGAGLNGPVNALDLLPNGELLVGGTFSTAGGNVSVYFARYSFTGVPTMSVQPASQSVGSGQTVTLSASPSNGYAGVGVQWLRNGVPVRDGPGGASAGGGTVSGASGAMPSPTNGTPATLTIADAQPSDSGEYRAVFTNACGSVTSAPAALAVAPPPCRADVNDDGELTFDDVTLFIAYYNASDPRADFNNDREWTFDDITIFVAAYNAGC